MPNAEDTMLASDEDQRIEHSEERLKTRNHGIARSERGSRVDIARLVLMCKYLQLIKPKVFLRHAIYCIWPVIA